MNEDQLLYRDEVFAIVGAAMEVHRVLGPGFLEAVYHEALEIELAISGIVFESQKSLSIMYKGYRLKKEYIADIVCFEKIIIELKAVDRLSTKEEAQLLNYLKATGMRVGLILNFGVTGKLDWKRFVR